MPTAVETVASVIATRLSEINEEQKRLESALSSLKGDRTTGTSRGPTRASSRAKRTPKGQRERQLLSSIEKNPNYKASDHAKALSVAPSQVYSLVKKLRKDKKVKKLRSGRLKLVKANS